MTDLVNHSTPFDKAQGGSLMASKKCVLHEKIVKLSEKEIKEYMPELNERFVNGLSENNFIIATKIDNIK